MPVCAAGPVPGSSLGLWHHTHILSRARHSEWGFFVENFFLIEMHRIWRGSYRHLQRCANKNRMEPIIPWDSCRSSVRLCRVPAPSPFDKAPRECPTSERFRGCHGSLNPGASSPFCSQPSCPLSYPLSPFFFKTIMCVPHPRPLLPLYLLMT